MLIFLFWYGTMVVTLLGIEWWTRPRIVFYPALWDELAQAAEEYLADPDERPARHRLERALEALD